MRNNPFRDDVGPRVLIEALNDARDAMSYSNFHWDKFDRIERIVRLYCREHGVKIKRSYEQEATRTEKSP